MSDIYAGLAVMGLLSAGALIAALKLRAGRRPLYGLAIATVCLIIFFSLFLLDDIRMAWLLPFSCLPVVGNWIPPMAFFLTGLAWRLISGKTWRRCVTVLALLLLCLWKSYGWFFEPPPDVGDTWKDGVCLQTSESTCSAASAATILAHYGIPATEPEMARLCMSRSWGTSMWGVYRGLKLKTSGTPYRVELFTPGNKPLRTMEGPLLLIVGLRRGEHPADRRYEEDWGWTPGTYHAVCFLAAGPDDLVRMADPSIGAEYWSDENIRVLWTGVGVRLVNR